MTAADDHPPTRPCVLRLSIDSGEKLAGSIGPDGGEQAPFQGWIELMAAISAARQQATIELGVDSAEPPLT